MSDLQELTNEMLQDSELKKEYEALQLEMDRDTLDIKKYSDIYKEISKLSGQDTLQLVLECETEDEKDFYEMIGDYLLQKKQREVLGWNK
jgi:hypothetical protein